VRDLTLSDFPFLASLAASESPRDRRIWLRVATDHFVAAGPEDPVAIEKFTNAMILQVDAADAGTRLEVARKLARCRRTPLALLARFETSDSEVCDFVLQHAVAYRHRDLKQAAARSVRRAVAVAKRADLSLELVETLSAHEDVDVLIALARNEFASLEGASLMRILREARWLAEESGDRRLAEALLRRRPVPPESAVLFLTAGPNQRVEILLATQRMQLGRPPGFSETTESATLDDLELAAVARQPERFVEILAKTLDCDQDLAQRIVDDASGEALAVALAALGASYEVLVRVLISNDLRGGASYQRIRALARLNNALNRNAAMMVIAALRGDDIVRRRQQPTTDGGTRAPPGGAIARAAATTAEPQDRKLAK
jgi:hypothetical protein